MHACISSSYNIHEAGFTITNMIEQVPHLSTGWLQVKQIHVDSDIHMITGS